jgi:hypothetical protein
MKKQSKFLKVKKLNKGGVFLIFLVSFEIKRAFLEFFSDTSL